MSNRFGADPRLPPWAATMLNRDVSGASREPLFRRPAGRKDAAAWRAERIGTAPSRAFTAMFGISRCEALPMQRISRSALPKHPGHIRGETPPSRLKMAQSGKPSRSSIGSRGKNNAVEAAAERRAARIAPHFAIDGAEVNRPLTETDAASCRGARTITFGLTCEGNASTPPARGITAYPRFSSITAKTVGSRMTLRTSDISSAASRGGNGRRKFTPGSRTQAVVCSPEGHSGQKAPLGARHRYGTVRRWSMLSCGSSCR